MRRFRATAIVGACAFCGAAALWFNSNAHPPVADAAGAPGVLELVATAIVKWRPAVYASTVFGVWHQLAAATTAALAAWATSRFTGSIAATVAIGLVAAASPLMAPTLAPPSVTALAVGAATWCAAVGGSAIGTVAGLVVAGAIAPGLALPCAVLCWLAMRREPKPGAEVRAIAAACVCVIVAGGVVLMLPPLPGHTMTPGALRAMVPEAANLTRAADAAAVAISVIGPLGLALAALGLFALVSERRPSARDATLACGLPAAVSIAALCPGAEPDRTFAIVVVGLWLLAGRGLAEILVRTRPGWPATGGLALVAIVLAVAVEPRLNPRVAAAGAPAPLGHDRLARQSLQALLYELPPGSALVSEDASTDILLRSLSTSLLRSRNAIRIIARTTEAVTTARGAARVFALPRAQSELQTRGVQFAAGLVPAVQGIAEVIAVSPCDVIDPAWRTAGSIPGLTRLALVSDNEAARGPLVIFTGGPIAGEATPVDWPALALRGFYTRRYDRTTSGGRDALAMEVANDAAPADHAAVNAPHVTRTELWRVPGAPRALAIELSSPADAALAAELPRAAGTLRLCPVYPFTVRELTRK